MAKTGSSRSNPRGKKASSSHSKLEQKVSGTQREKTAELASGKEEAVDEAKLVSGGDSSVARDSQVVPPPKKRNAKKQVKEAREAVYDQLPQIVKGLASKSGDSYLTAKFLFDFAKVEEISKSAKHPGKPASVAGLLKKLGFADAKGGAGERSKMDCSKASKCEES